jgi:hypothetical protein
MIDGCFRLSANATVDLLRYKRHYLAHRNMYSPTSHQNQKIAARANAHLSFHGLGLGLYASGKAALWASIHCFLRVDYSAGFNPFLRYSAQKSSMALSMLISLGGTRFMRFSPLLQQPLLSLGESAVCRKKHSLRHNLNLYLRPNRERQ